jgi:hypothetical protein
VITLKFAFWNTHSGHTLEFEGNFYEADIPVDVIWSNGWMAEKRLIPLPEWSQLGVGEKAEIHLLTPLRTLEPLGPPLTNQLTSLNLVGTFGDCYNVTASLGPGLGVEEENSRCPKRFYCPQGCGQPEVLLTPKEEENVWENSGQPQEEAQVFGMVETEKPVVHSLAEALRGQLLEDYKDTVFREEIAIDPKPRSPYGMPP